MFALCYSFNGDVSGWNVSTITDMGDTFYNCTDFNRDLSGWDMSNVTDISYMFEEATSFNSDISNWDVSKVSSMEATFTNATSFDQDLSGWDLSSIDPNLMGDMFLNAKMSTANYDATLIGWAEDSSGSPDDGIDDIPSNVILFSGGESTYCNAETARNTLINTYNWEITDGGLDCSVQNPDAFITTWKTDNPGTTEDNQILIPTFNGETYDYTVDWGDGTSDSNVTGDIIHTYAAPGTYNVKITGLFPRIYFSGLKDEEKILSIEQWGTNPWTDFTFAFEDCENMNISNSAGAPNLSNCTSLYGMFQYCYALDADLNSWNVNTITDMTEVFNECISFNQPLTGWDVSNAELFTDMFGYAVAFNQDLTSWVMTSAKRIDNMFEGATNFNGDVSNWDVSNVEQMDNVFSEATKFNRDISSWNTSSATTLRRMFNDAVDFDQNLGAWDLSAVTNMEDMFKDAGMSTANYDSTLNGWATDSSGNPLDGDDDIPENITFNGGSSTYCESEASRTLLSTASPAGYNWSITDSGLDCSTLGLTELDSFSFSVYPNPASQIVHLEGALNEVTSIALYDLHGKRVFEQNSNFNHIDMSSLEKSIYILKISTKDAVKHIKLIKD